MRKSYSSVVMGMVLFGSCFYIKIFSMFFIATNHIKYSFYQSFNTFLG